jgi:hypothetical protein
MLKRTILFLIICLSLTLAWGQGLETFDNLSLTGNSYANGTFLGQDGSDWTYVQCRGDHDIDENALMIGRDRTPQSNFYSGTIDGGIGSLSFDYMQAFGTDVNMNVLVNDVVVGNVTSSSQQEIILSSETFVVNVEGPFVLKFQNVNNSDGQVVIDNISWTGYTGTGDPYASTPVFDPPAGTYFSAQNVSITSDTQGASIYYSLDGSTPDDQSTLYTSAITISETTTLKAIAYAPGHNPSAVRTGEYVIPTPAYAALPYNETFDSDLGDAYAFSVLGDSKQWIWGTHNGNGFASMNGYGSNETEEDWLVLPGFDLVANPYAVLTFDTWHNYGQIDDNNYLKLMYSTDYYGIGNPGDATWNELSFSYSQSTSTWEGSGPISLSDVSANPVFIAFKYHGMPGEYKHWEVDNISVANIPPQTPMLYVTPSSISNLTYITGEGPSAAQSFSLSGENIGARNILITAPENFQISFSSDSGFTSSLSATVSQGAYGPADIYVRLISGLEISPYNGEITISAGAAIPATVSLSGAVTTPLPVTSILLRPTQIDISDANHESAVLVNVQNYPTDDARYRLYSGGNQYAPWDSDANEGQGDWITSTSYSNGPQIPGNPSTGVSWWIPFRIGSNPSTAASYRDRLGPGYSTNYQTQALPAATQIQDAAVITQNHVGLNALIDYSRKHIVLAYDAPTGGNLIAAASTALQTGVFSIRVESGTAIQRIEIRDVMNSLLDSVVGSWPIEGDLEVPVVEISRTMDSVTLSWASIPGAVGYRVEYSDDPYGTFQLHGYTGDTQITIPNQQDQKRFYRVIASDTPPAR